jgi:hypothetical protein
MKLNSDLLLGIVYIPPEYSRYSSPDAFSQIENEYLEFTELSTLFRFKGKFNCCSTFGAFSMKPSKVSKRVFSSNVINSSSSAVLALKFPIRQIFLNFKSIRFQFD